MRQLQAQNASLIESERQTAAELGQRLIEIAAQGQRATDSLVEKELLASAVETVQVRGAAGGCSAVCSKTERAQQASAMVATQQEAFSTGIH